MMVLVANERDTRSSLHLHENPGMSLIVGSWHVNDSRKVTFFILCFVLVQASLVAVKKQREALIKVTDVLSSNLTAMRAESEMSMNLIGDEVIAAANCRCVCVCVCVCV